MLARTGPAARGAAAGRARSSRSARPRRPLVVAAAAPAPAPAGRAASAARATPPSPPPPPLAFSFSAGGLLFPYHWGVATELARLGALDPARTPLAGASAGSIIVACLRSGLSVDRVTDACLSLAADCRANGTRTRLGPVLEAMLGELLPEDAHERVSEGGTAHIAVTRLFPKQGAAADTANAPSSSSSSSGAQSAAAAVAARVVRPELLNAFHSRDDLIGAVLTSSHIPWYLNGQPTRTFRGGQCLDGGLTMFIPQIPGTTVSGGSSSSSSDSDEEGASAAAVRLVRVTCFPSRGMDAAVQRAARLLGPDASASAVAEAAAAAAAMQAEQAQAPPLPRFADLAPDRFGDWGVSMREAVQMALEPAPEATLLALLDKGREDARAWLAADRNGGGGGGGGAR